MLLSYFLTTELTKQVLFSWRNIASLAQCREPNPNDRIGNNDVEVPQEVTRLRTGPLRLFDFESTSEATIVVM
jgi:hypothetical protein